MRPLPNSLPNLCLLRSRSSLKAGSIALVIVTSLVLAVSASAQQGSANAPSAEDAPTLASKVRVVNVLATVRDKHGKIVPKLAVSDFTLEEDGKPVTIRYFSKETDLPLKLGLLVDTSMSQRQFLDQEKSASKKFFDQLLREKDSAFLIHFDRETELLQDFTSSRSKLEAALDLLHTPSPYEEQNTGSDAPAGDDSPGEGRRGRLHHSGTTLYDAIYLACDELMKKQTGRKAVVVLSDGVDRGSKESLESAIEAAQRADTVVYSVLFKGENPFNERRGGFGFPDGGPMGGGQRGGGRRRGGNYPQEEHVDGKKVLERISKETGGRLFEASKKDSLDQIYATIEDELRNQYNLGFTPAKSDTSGYHKLLLKTNEKDYTIQTRDGFYLDQD